MSKITMERTQTPTLTVRPVTVDDLSTVDLPGMIAHTIERKVDGQFGRTYHGDSFKDKSRVFSAVCAAVKTKLGLPLNSRLPDEVAAAINEAIKDSWQEQANAILDFGRVTGSSWNKPKAIYTKGISSVLGVVATASINAERDARDDKEALAFTFELQRKAGERLDSMRKATHGKYTAEDLAMQQARIEALAKFHKALTEKLTPVRRAVATREAKAKARTAATPPVVSAEATAPTAK